MPHFFVVEKLHNLNKTNKVNVRKITDAEKRIAEKFFEDDLRRLQDEFKIIL